MCPVSSGKNIERLFCEIEEKYKWFLMGMCDDDLDGILYSCRFKKQS